MKRNVKIIGSGSYLPKRIVSSDELDEMLNMPLGSCYKLSGVKNRYWVSDETVSEMAKIASLEALKQAGFSANDLDLIVSTSGAPEQIIPNNSSLIQEKLNLQNTGIPCLDINTTCLSFVTGLDVISYLIHSKAYSRVLLVSSDISSKGLNKHRSEEFANFGDGAAAFVLTYSEDESGITSSLQETYSEGVHYNEIIGGGSLLPSYNLSSAGEDKFLFKMNGKQSFKLVRKKMIGFVNRACSKENKTFRQCVEECTLVIPHQASAKSLKLIRLLLDVPVSKWVNEIDEYGNMISVSIPFLFDKYIREGKLKRGDKYIIIATGAGLSLGFIKGVY